MNTLPQIVLSPTTIVPKSIYDRNDWQNQSLYDDTKLRKHKQLEIATLRRDTNAPFYNSHRKLAEGNTNKLHLRDTQMYDTITGGSLVDHGQRNRE